MIANALIAARVTTDKKQAFAAVARRQGLPESALLKRYVDAALLQASAFPAPVVDPVEPIRGDARVSVRLQAGDMLLLRERAAAREMPPSTYVCAGSQRMSGLSNTDTRWCCIRMSLTLTSMSSSKR